MPTCLLRVPSITKVRHSEKARASRADEESVPCVRARLEGLVHAGHRQIVTSSACGELLTMTATGRLRGTPRGTANSPLRQVLRCSPGRANNV